jgi:hypothetical protein
MSDQVSTAYLLLRSAHARKVGLRATGKIQYDVLCDTKRTSVFIRISSNEGGGYFSREMIDFDKAVECIASFGKDRPLPSKVFAPAFVGKSSNNAGFLAAVLRAEQLLDAAPGTDFQHIASGDWTTWKTEMLKLEGAPLVESPSANVTKAPSDASIAPTPNATEHTEHTRDAKSRKKHASASRQ